MHFLGSRGMVSDDAEHTCFVAQSLIATAGEPKAFVRALARQSANFWLLGGTTWPLWRQLFAIPHELDQAELPLDDVPLRVGDQRRPGDCPGCLAEADGV